MRDRDAGKRAEAVRKRRREQTGKRVTDSATFAARPLAPIISRAGIMPAAPPLTARPNTRRRERPPVSMPGIEIRLPTISFSGLQVKWRVMSFSLSLLLGASLYIAWTSMTFRAAMPDFSGNARIGAEEMSAVMGIGGARVFELIPSELENRLRLNYPELLSARVTVNLPNEVAVSISERIPMILWQQADGYTWIDADGVAFRPRGNVENLIAVEARGAPAASSVEQSDPLAPRPFLPRDLVEAVQALAPSAPAATPIIYDVRYGLGWTDSRGWQAFFGDHPGDMALRLRVYQSMVQMVSEQGIVPSLINVQYPSAPYYRTDQ